MNTLTKLMWVPGLFWLFPVAVHLSDTREEIFYLHRVCMWHVFYTAAQLVASFAAISYVVLMW